MQAEEYGREMYKISKLFASKKKDEKDKKSRILDSKDDESKSEEKAAINVVNTIRNQIDNFKVIK